MDLSPVLPTPGIEAPPPSGLNKIDEQWLDTHLSRIRKLIADEAIRIANDREAPAPEGLDVAEAARRFAPGVKFPATLGDRIKASVSGITVVSAVLVVLFGFLGLWASHGKLGGADANAASYFDIVKLFAGAIVGSTGAGVLVNSRQK